MDTLKFGIITVSDSCTLDKSEDRSGLRLQEEIVKVFSEARIDRAIIPDEKEIIKETLQKFCDGGCTVIFTTGGTGFSPRDVTPEATKEFISKEANGLSFALIMKSLEITEMAMLSRPVCGIRGKTLILNFPGSTKAAVGSFGIIKGALPHAISVLNDISPEIVAQHEVIQNENVLEKSTCFIESKVKLNKAAHRKRVSPYEMVEVEEALQIISKESVPTLETEVIFYEECFNRVLAENIYATEPVPPFRAATKDGYAATSFDDSYIRKVVKYVSAGDENTERGLKKGEVFRISTGAVVPPGADTVIPVEETWVKETSVDGEEIKIEIRRKDKTGNIREIGSDIEVDSLVMKKFERITHFHIGVLATLGKTQVKIFKKPTIGLLSTGNEVLDPSDQVKPGQIRDANKSTLTHLLKRYGYHSKDFGITKDEPNTVKGILEKAFAQCDIVITTGGMSMGEYDILKDVLVEDFGAMIHFGRVNMKPGKPTAFATLTYNGKLKLYFGLPGNPVSSSVTCILFVIPILRKLERNENYEWPVITVSSDLTNEDQRPEYHRVLVKIAESPGNFQLESTGNQISSRLNSMLGANGLAIIKGTAKEQLKKPRSCFPSMETTKTVNVILFDDLLM